MDGPAGVPGPQPLAGARRGRRPSRRAAHRLGPRTGGAVRRRAHRRAGVRGGPRRARSRGLAQDLGIARHPRVRPHRPRVVVHRGQARGAGAGPRGRASPSRPRDEQVVEGGAPRGVPRLQPERPRPDGGQRLQRPSDGSGVGAAALGRGGRRGAP